MQARWEGDDRGQGVGEGSVLAEGVRELASLAATPNWVAEAPERHLLPRIREACAAPDSFISLLGTEITPDGALLIDLHEREPSGSVGLIRAAAYALLGQVSESATYIRQRRDPLRFEVLTGTPGSDGRFATHGHTLILRIR